MPKKSDFFELSIIIPTKNGNERLKKNLDQLINKSGVDNSKYEIIVVDSHSESPFSYENDQNVNLEIINLTKDCGRSGSRNIGINSSNGKNILFMDDDIYPCENFIKFHLEEIEKFPDMAILGNIELKKENLKCMDYVWDTSIYFDKLENHQMCSFIQFITGNISVPSDILKKSGGFSEEFKGWGYEDIELGYRLEEEHGLKIIHSKLPTSIHNHEKSSETYINNLREKGKNSLKLFKLHQSIVDKIDLEVTKVIDNFINKEFIISEEQIYEKITSCLELEEMGNWRNDEKFRDMLIKFYENLAINIERRSIYNELKKIIKQISVIIIAKHSLRNVLTTLGSIISNNYPLEYVKVIIYDPEKISGLENFFKSYSPPIALSYMSGNNEDLKNLFKNSAIDDDFILFIDDTLRASKNWLMNSVLEHKKGVEKIDGVILPDTPIGRYSSQKIIFIDELKMKTKNINSSFTWEALVSKKENEISKITSSKMIVLREMPYMLSIYLTDIIKFYKLCKTKSEKQKRLSLKFFLSFFKYFLHVVRFKKRGYSINDSLMFPIFDKIYYYLIQ